MEYNITSVKRYLELRFWIIVIHHQQRNSLPQWLLLKRRTCFMLACCILSSMCLKKFSASGTYITLYQFRWLLFLIDLLCRRVFEISKCKSRTRKPICQVSFTQVPMKEIYKVSVNSQFIKRYSFAPGIRNQSIQSDYKYHLTIVETFRRYNVVTVNYLLPIIHAQGWYLGRYQRKPIINSVGSNTLQIYKTYC